jgi:hypothetical protein
MTTALTASGPSSLLSEEEQTSPPDTLLGSTYPRLFSVPLISGPEGPCGCGCALTPATSYGFKVDDFAREILEMPLDPWERWLVIHAGELLPDGRPRFRKLLVIVARQNGKTHLLVVLSLFWMFVQKIPLILGTSTNLDYAKESWEKAVQIAEEIEELWEDVPARTGVRYANGEQTFRTVDKSRYKIGTASRKGGRSLTVHRLILDELREHHSWDSWNASYRAMNAVKTAQVFAITNQGDAKSVVLDSLRKEAMKVIEGGRGDLRLGLFEWSAVEGSEPDDLEALAAANPNLGLRIDPDDLVAEGQRAKENGGEELAQFLTEVLCLRVTNLDPAVDEKKWLAGHVAGDLSKLRDRVVMVMDVSMDQKHAVLVAGAVLDDRRVRVDAVKAWSGPDAMNQLRAELADEVAKVKPKKFGWFPSGPAAAIAADLRAPKADGTPAWAPAGVEVEELKADVPAICMGLAEQVESGQVVHSNDPLLNAHVAGAAKLRQGDVWRFTRRGGGHCNGAYATAGVVHLARTLPLGLPEPEVV